MRMEICCQPMLEALVDGIIEAGEHLDAFTIKGCDTPIICCPWCNVSISIKAPEVDP